MNIVTNSQRKFLWKLRVLQKLLVFIKLLLIMIVKIRASDTNRTRIPHESKESMIIPLTMKWRYERRNARR